MYVIGLQFLFSTFSTGIKQFWLGNEVDAYPIFQNTKWASTGQGIYSVQKFDFLLFIDKVEIASSQLKVNVGTEQERGTIKTHNIRKYCYFV
jgi:hypothetical protein